MPLNDHTRKEIEAFDARVDTSLQLNSSKVLAQKGVFSLIIGVGGTGVDALLETKGLINKTCCLSTTQRDKPTDHVAYLAFDTDKEAEDKTSTQHTGGARLEDGELLRLAATDMEQTLSPAYRDQVPSYIRSWLDFNIDVHSGTDGAGGIRQCGRLLLFKNITAITDAIRKAVERITANQRVVRMNVYILAGIGGGTGSGTFLDMAYIARKTVKDLVGATVASFYGYLFLPDVNLSRNMPDETRLYIQKNGYAALKELDYLMNVSKDGGKFTQQYSDKFYIDTTEPPFNFVHLISGRGANHQIINKAYEHSMMAVAQSILSFVAEEKNEATHTEFAMASHYSNIGAATAQFQSAYPERSNVYLSLGTYDYELPIDQILLYVTSLLFEKMDSMFTCEPTQKDVNQARATLGLIPSTLISSLIGDGCNLAEGGMPKWEDLFGKNPKYNYQKRCQQWLNNITVHIHEQAERFVKNFPEKFVTNCDSWFVNGTRGPVWVNHLIINDKETCSGLVACLRNDIQTASQRMVKLRDEKQQMEDAIAACTNKAARTGVLGNRKAAVQEYIETLNAYGNLCAELVATQELSGDENSVGILANCGQVIIEQNNNLFNVVTEVLLALKQVCENNTDILTQAEMDQTGHNFTWKPLRIPDVSPTIKQAFDAAGTAQETIAKFSASLLNEAKNWAKDGVNVRSFIRKYLDDNLSNIANCSLETYVQASLHGQNLVDSVNQYLVPDIETMSVPMFDQSDNVRVGGTYTMLSVPYSCTNIKQAIEEYYKKHPDVGNNTVIQASAINSRIFAQSLGSCISLAAYKPLSEYEKVYLQSMNTKGVHLYMNKNGEKDAQDWDDLPCPIPARSRPRLAGAYPEAIKRVEDEQRQLYKTCRERPIILKDGSGTRNTYTLRIADLPDLDRNFAAEQMMGRDGRLDFTKLEDSIQQLTDWKTKGLPEHQSSAADDPATYQVATVAANEADAETIAQECFLGEYNNLNRARKELAKYKTLESKLAELEEILRKDEEDDQNAKNLVVLLTSGLVHSKRLQDSTLGYVYNTGKGKEDDSVLVKLSNEEKNIREVILSKAIVALANDEEPLKRRLYDDLMEKATSLYQKMSNSKEGLNKKIKAMEDLRVGATTRADLVRQDILRHRNRDFSTHDAETFYEKIQQQLDSELEYARLDLKDFGDDQSGDEF